LFWNEVQENRIATAFGSKFPTANVFDADNQAIETLLRLAEEYTGHTRTLAGQGQDSVKGLHSQDSLQVAEADLKVRYT
jgi:hypothetical protein